MIQQGGDLAVAVFRCQGSDPSDDHRIGPSHFVGALGARNFEHRAALGLPADGYLDERLSSTESHIFDQISQQLFSGGLRRRWGVPDLREILSQCQDPASLLGIDQPARYLRAERCVPFHAFDVG